MAANQVELQLAQVRALDVHFGELAEAGVHSKDDSVGIGDALDDRARSFDARMRGNGNAYCFALDRDARDLRETQGLAI